jgi:hypothetical protein
MPVENEMHHIEIPKSHTILHVDSDTLMELIAADAVTHPYQWEEKLHRSGWVALPTFWTTLNRIESNDAN